MFPTDFLIFLQIILFLFITPGAPRVLIVSHTLNYTLRRSVWTAFGDISANICQGILVVFFIGTFLKDNPEILSVLKWIGILYIGYLAHDHTSKIKSFIDNREIKILHLNQNNLDLSSFKNLNVDLKRNGETLEINYKPSEIKFNDLLKAINESNLDIKDISIKETKLEDVFLKLTQG